MSSFFPEKIEELHMLLKVCKTFLNVYFLTHFTFKVFIRLLVFIIISMFKVDKFFKRP